MLFWFEAMSLLGILGNAAFALSNVVRWLQVSRPDARELARDGMKFIHNFCIGSSASTPHLYISALPFCPENSALYRTLKPKFGSLTRAAVGHNQDWPASQVLPLQGHTDLVTSVEFSPDGKRIVSGSSDKSVRVWDADTGVQIGSPLQGHTDWVMSVGFSPDGTRIVSGSEDKTVRVWDANKGLQIGSPLQGHTDLVRSVEFSPDGTRLVSGSDDKTVRIWDSGTEVTIIKDVEANDGWIKGPHGQLLLWVPQSHRQPFYSPCTRLVIPRGCVELDLSRMVHGKKWQQCFQL
ncbi:hypothetical protein SCLCIDRAFT_127030 [Scleroderma citrinum Foug A]|uniref:Uncharacterized protein n=1 Tax=Scleroderma citrinum Foug A TaxID=1036808 RepID=A0A0C3A2Q7_9AGAM|nr:hypothetical protein SCLCIDRAFT_127030 [Scleroderma citrinum Foug A]